MLKISIAQARKRFKKLPAVLQDKIFSVHTAEIINLIAAQNSLPDEATKDVAEVAGLVLLGFIHPEDMSNELIERGITPPEIAKSIYESLNKRIFEPLKNELDVVYEPAIEDEPPETEEHIIEEIKTPESAIEPNIEPKIKPPKEIIGKAPKKEQEPPKKPLSPQTPQASKEPKPVMLYEEKEPEPIKKSFRVRIDLAKKEKQENKEPLPPKPALLELGEKTKEESSKSQTEETASKKQIAEQKEIKQPVRPKPPLKPPIPPYLKEISPAPSKSQGPQVDVEKKPDLSRPVPPAPERPTPLPPKEEKKRQGEEPVIDTSILKKIDSDNKT